MGKPIGVLKAARNGNATLKGLYKQFQDEMTKCKNTTDTKDRGKPEIPFWFMLKELDMGSFGIDGYDGEFDQEDYDEFILNPNAKWNWSKIRPGDTGHSYYSKLGSGSGNRAKECMEEICLVIYYAHKPGEGGDKSRQIPGLSRDEMLNGETSFDAKYNLSNSAPQGAYEFIVAFASKNNPMKKNMWADFGTDKLTQYGKNARRNILLKADTNTYTQKRLAIDMTFRKFDQLATVAANKHLSAASVGAVQHGNMFFAVHKPPADGKPGRYFLAAGVKIRKGYAGRGGQAGFFDVAQALDQHKPAIFSTRTGYGKRPDASTQTAWVRSALDAAFEEYAGVGMRKGVGNRSITWATKGIGRTDAIHGIYALHEKYGAAIKEAGIGVIEYSEFEKWNRYDKIDANADKGIVPPTPWGEASLGSKMVIQGLPGGSIRNSASEGFKAFGNFEKWSSAGKNYESYFQVMLIELIEMYADQVGPEQDKNYTWTGSEYKMKDTNQGVYDRLAEKLGHIVAPEYQQIYQQCLVIDVWARLLADEHKNMPKGEKGYKVGTPTSGIGRNALNGAKEKNKVNFVDPIKKGAKAAAGKEPPEKVDPAEDEKKQRFVKQCALMLNMEELKNVYKKNVVAQRLAPKSIHYGLPFNGRLAMVGCLDPKRITEIENYCVMPNKKLLEPLLRITPAMASALMPMIRLHKVSTVNGRTSEVTFPWPSFEKRDYPRSLKKDPDIDRGGGFGIKEFNWSFEGTHPGTARNDIKAELTLYFQNFREFFKERKTGGKKWSYVDLVLFPGAGHKRKSKKNKQPKKTGFGSSHKRKNDPSYYRIRVDCGWNIPDKSSFSSLMPSGMSYGKFVKALEITNKSFYLNMVDHDIDIRTDGTVQIKIEYRAYIESAMKKPEFDALSSPKIMAERMQFSKEYEALKAKCTPDQLAELEKTYDGLEESYAEASYQSIVKRLIDRNRLFYGFVDKAAVDSVLSSGKLTRHPTFTFGGQSTGEGSQDSQAKGGASKPTVTWDESATQYKDFVPPNPEDHNTMCTYFYLGDLFHTCMDGIYKANVVPLVDSKGQIRNVGRSVSETLPPTKPKDGDQGLCILLSDFEYQISPKLGSAEVGGPPKFGTMNIAEVPISLEYFFEWFQKKVIDVKRKTYPIANFIRDLLNELMGSVFAQACWSKKIDKRVAFQSSNFMVVKDAELGVLGNVVPSSDIAEENYKLATDVRYDRGLMPWSSFKRNATVGDYANMVFIYPKKQNDYNQGRGNHQLDGMRGIHHYTIGSPTGLVKSVKFSKTDNAYLKEARFMSHGNQGLMQLGNVYEIDLDMIGNTLYYPGMYLFLDPRGIGGLEWDPTKGPKGGKPSAANALGFGGYHVVIGVKSSITTSGFSTSVKAMFDYSGDGSKASEKILEDNALIEQQSAEFKKSCEEAIKNRQAELATMDRLIQEGTAGANPLDKIDTHDIRHSRALRRVAEAGNKTMSSGTPAVPASDPREPTAAEIAAAEQVAATQGSIDPDQMTDEQRLIAEQNVMAAEAEMARAAAEAEGEPSKPIPANPVPEPSTPPSPSAPVPEPQPDLSALYAPGFGPNAPVPSVPSLTDFTKSQTPSYLGGTAGLPTGTITLTGYASEEEAQADFADMKSLLDAKRRRKKR